MQRTLCLIVLATAGEQGLARAALLLGLARLVDIALDLRADDDVAASRFVALTRLTRRLDVQPPLPTLNVVGAHPAERPLLADVQILRRYRVLNTAFFL